MIESLIANQLETVATGWSIGVTGVLAEFERDEGEPALLSAASVVTARGAIGLSLHPQARAIAYESLSARPGSWLHGIALCLPRDACRLHARTTITEVGPDAGALRAEDRDGILFDLGLNAECFDFLVRTADPDQIAVLRGAAGRALLAEHALCADLARWSPHRVFVSALGRIEIYQPIAAEGGGTPQGPHTHLLPDLLRKRHDHSANLPVPSGWVVCATLYPANPLRDREGEVKPFDASQHEAFQALLAAFGDAGNLSVKRDVLRAVRSAVPPAAFPEIPGRHARLARRVALRQLAHTDGTSATLTSWQNAFDAANARTVEDAEHA